MPDNNCWKTFDISSFSDLTSINEKLCSMKRDIDKILESAYSLDKKEDVYSNTIKIRKAMQKLKQKAQNIRSHCLNIRKY